MNAFSLDVSPKEADGADAIDVVNRRVLTLVYKRIRSGHTTKAEIARRLGVNRSTVSRMLRGNQNLTARTIGEILGAIDYSLSDLVTVDRLKDRQNIPMHHHFTSIQSNHAHDDGHSSPTPSDFSVRVQVSQ